MLLSSNFVDNGPFALRMDDFLVWFLVDKNVGGGSNGSGCHRNEDQYPVEVLRTFEDFRYVADADPRIVEIFNENNDYSACFVRALQKGWQPGRPPT